MDYLQRARCILLALASLCFLSGNPSAIASGISANPDLDSWGTDGTVFALGRLGEVVYLGGTFSNLVSSTGVKLPAGNLASLDVRTGQPTSWRPNANGTVFVITTAEDGSAIYVGGAFNKLDSVTRPGFVACGLNGNVLWSADCGGAVKAIALSGSKIYLGGTFASVNGQPRRCVAAIQPPTSGNKATVLPWSPSITGGEETVNGLALANGDLVAMGKFDFANGQPELYQARFDAITGVSKGWEDNIDTAVKGLVTDGLNYFAAQGGGGGKVVCWGPTGKFKWRKSGDGDVQAIAYCAGQIIAGGHWNNWDGTTLGRLVALNPLNGAADRTWFPNPDLGGDKGVWALCDGGDRLHVGGGFKWVGTTRYDRYAQFAIPDGQPPTTPTNVNVTATSPIQVDLKWRASTDNKRLIGYEIWRNNNLLKSLGTVTNFTDRAVVPGLAYSYRLRAMDASGLYSGYSPPLDVTTPTDLQNPTAPTDLTATVVAPAQIALAWVAATDNVGIKNYLLYRDGVQVATLGVITNYSDKTVVPATHYDYHLIARDLADLLSDPSNEAEATTPPDVEPPAAPLNLNATASSGTEVKLGWNRAVDNVGIAGYDIYRAGLLLTTVGAITNYIDGGLLPLTTYQYELIARDLANNLSTPSAPASGKTLADKVVPGKPLNLNGLAYNSRQVDLTWVASTDNVAVTGYRLYRNDALIATLGAVTNCSDATCSPSKSYSYKLRAFDAAGNQSGYSSSKIVSTPSRDTAPPSAPTNLVATANSATRIDLTWKAATDNRKIVAYDIYRDGALLMSIGAVTNYMDATVLPLTTYGYQVRARDAEGNVSIPSNLASATTPADTTPPSAPGNLTATAIGPNQVDLAWTASIDDVGVTSYEIYRDGGLLESITLGLSYSDTTALPFTTYSYQVFARDAANNLSDPSNTASVTTPDTQAPSTPGELTATATGPTQIDLGWTASVDDVGVTAYDVYRNGGLLASIGLVTNYSDTSVMPLTTYAYQVRARDGAGNVSDPSNEATATTPADTTPPTAPTNLVANVISATQIDLAWDTATDNVAVTGYNIYRDGGLLTNLGAVTNYSDTALSPDTAYNYEVRARDAAGNESDPSNAANATTSADTTAPGGPPNLTAIAPSATQIHLDWDASTDDVSLTGYDVYRNGGLLMTVGTVTHCADTNLLPLTTYSYEVRARDAAGNVSDPSTASATTLADTTPPTAPTGLTALAMSGAQIDLTWTPSGDDVAVTGYEIHRDGSWLASIGTTTSYSDMMAYPATTYQYEVFGRDNAGNISDPSDTASATTPDTVAPSAPSDLTASAPTATRVDLAWTAATDNVAVTGYEVFRDGSLLATIGGALTNYSDTTVGPLTAYEYQVRARDAANNVSDATGTANVTTLPDITPPTTPTNLSAVATSWIQIDLSWEESTDDVGVLAYDLYRDGVFLATGTETNYSDIPVLPFTSYEYQVYARDAAGNVSDPSNPAVVTTSGDTEQPSAPTDLTANATSATQVELAWTEATDNVAVTGYNVIRDGSQIAILGTTTNYTDTTAAPDTAYNYEAKARDAAGNLSDLSNPASVTTPPDTDPPDAPSNLSGSAPNSTQVDLIWDGPTDNVAVTGYEVYRDGLLIDTIGAQTTYSDSTVAGSTTYNYEVRALDAAGNVSGSSNAASVSTL